MKKKTKIIVIITITLIIAAAAAFTAFYLIEKKQLEDAVEEKALSLRQLEWVAKTFDMYYHYIHPDGTVNMSRIYDPSPDQFKDVLGTEIVLTPTPRTYEAIENINMYTKVNGIDMSKYDLPQTLTLEDIKNNPDKIFSLINEDIYAIEYKKYGSEPEADASLSQLVGEGHLSPKVLFSREYQ